MRKLFSGLLAVLFLVSLSTIAAAAQSSETDAAITAAYGTPKIDGEFDDIWQTTVVSDVKKVDSAVIPSDSKTTGTVRVMWDKDYLYFYITVDKHGVEISSGGGSENTDDCADVCFTMNGNFEGENNVNGGDEYAGVYRVLLDGTASGFGDFQVNNISDFKGVMKKTSDTTYACEYAIPWADIKPEAGYAVSMDIQINDATDGERTGLVNWAYEPCYGWRDSKYHGMVTLLEEVVETEEPDIVEDDVQEPDADETVAPPTSDAAWLSIFLLGISCAAAAVTAKKRNN